jgi:hypothetical protein
VIIFSLPSPVFCIFSFDIITTSWSPSASFTLCPFTILQTDNQSRFNNRVRGIHTCGETVVAAGSSGPGVVVKLKLDDGPGSERLLGHDVNVEISSVRDVRTRRGAVAGAPLSNLSNRPAPPAIWRVNPGTYARPGITPY